VKRGDRRNVEVATAESGCDESAGRAGARRAAAALLGVGALNRSQTFRQAEGAHERDRLRATVRGDDGLRAAALRIARRARRVRNHRDGGVMTVASGMASGRGRQRCVRRVVHGSECGDRRVMPAMVRMTRRLRVHCRVQRRGAADERRGGSHRRVRCAHSRYGCQRDPCCEGFHDSSRCGVPIRRFGPRAQVYTSPDVARAREPPRISRDSARLA
jgi:hypothetical protein